MFLFLFVCFNYINRNIAAFLESYLANLLKFGMLSDSTIPLLGISPIEGRALADKDIRTKMFIATLQY